MVPYDPGWSNMLPYGLVCFCMVTYDLVWSCKVLFGPIWFPIVPYADQEKILALLASWSFHRNPTAKRRNFFIEKVLSITKKQDLKGV